MPKDEIRDYKFGDALLKQFSDEIVTNVTRDMSNFATRGVTTASITALQTLIDGFSGIATDDEMIGRITTATENKEAAKDVLLDKLREIRDIAQDKYEGKGLYRSFGLDDINKLDDANLVQAGRRVHRVGSEQLAELAGNGLTAAMLAALKTATDNMDAGIDAIRTAESNRDIAAQERVAAGNNLFAKVNRLADMGKSLFAKDAARYNDYVLPAFSSGNGGDAPSATE